MALMHLFIVDWINIINYDYTGSWSATLGPNTPLNGTSSIVSTLALFKTVPSNKLVVGLANYARTFKLSVNTTFGSSFSGKL